MLYWGQTTQWKGAIQQALGLVIRTW
jgi:hypothetical protein